MPEKSFEYTEAITFPPGLFSRLNNIAESTGESKNTLVLTALEHYLEDLEDLADAEAVMARIAQGTEEALPLDDVVKKLGLDLRHL